MSWNGTVTCGWCYEEGHNKRTCPSYTKALQERAATSTGYAKEYAEEELNRRGKGKAGSHRKCSFCDKRGHDRRTCETMNVIVEEQAAHIIEGRQKIIDLARKANFGVGSLIEFQHSGYDKEGKWVSSMKRVGTVQAVQWSEFSHKQLTSYGSNNSQLIEVKFFDSYANKERTTYCSAPFEIIDDGRSDGDPVPEGSHLRRTKMIAPSVGPVTTPDDFFSAKACKKIARAWMKDKKAWQYSR